MDITTSQPKSCQKNFSESPQTSSESTKPTQTYSPSEKHLVEWCEGSGVSEAIARLAVRYLRDRKVIAHRIGWKVYSDEYSLGWFASGLDIATMKPQAFGQFKPDVEIQFPEKEKPTKYLSDKGHPYDAIALPHPDKDYWQRVLDDVSTIVDLDEGTKKSGAGMTCGLPSLALCGVAMWQFKGELVSNLAVLAVPGRTFRIRFDMDVLTKKEVRLEVKKLVKALEARGCTVLVAMWDKELGLKIDDVKVEHGPEMVHKIMSEAQPYPQWLKSLEAQIKESGTSEGDAPAKAKKPPTPRRTAAQIAEEYGHHWKYDNEQKTWRVWNGKCWEKIEIGAFTSLLKTTLDTKNIDYPGSAYIEDVKKLLEHDLRQVHWQAWDNTQYINFSNCVLEGNKNKTLEHSPGMGFTSYLPYEYKSLAGDLGDSLEALKVNCPKIYQFFHEAMGGDRRMMFKLLAIINALLKRRFFDLQMFIHLIGKPGGGKGKFARLCQKLVGKDNSIGCQLERLTDGSTKASLIDKQLVVFPDERKPVGIDSILSLTGGDVISYRELHTPAASAYFYGSLLICSNKPIFIGDTTGLERRLCLVDFGFPVDDDKRDHSLEAELDAEIPALITIALSLPDSAVTQAIRGNGANQIMEFKIKEWEMKLETDSIAAFFDTEVLLDPVAITPTSKLYEVYKTWCDSSGLKPFSLTKFPRHLSELLADQKLHAKWVKARTSTFEGLRLRQEFDEHPTYSQSLESLAPLDAPLCTTSVPLDAPLEGIHSKDLHHLHHLEGKVCQENSKNQIPLDNPSEPKEFPPPSGASGAKSLPVSITSGTEVVQDTSPSGAAPAIIESIRAAITTVDKAAALKARQEIKNSLVQQEEVKSYLTADENLNFRLLLNTGFVKGTRVRYIGSKFADQLAGMVLVVDGFRDRNGIPCLKPDGSYTTDLDKEDLEKIEQPATDSVTVQPIALPENSQPPEPAEPAPAPTESESVETPAQPTDTSSEPELEVETEPEVVEDAE